MEQDIVALKERVVAWVRGWFEENGKDCTAVIGISGGKDSSVCAAVLVEALGAERVLGVLMPQGRQHDIDMARLLCAHLGIRSLEINIGAPYESLVGAFVAGGIPAATLGDCKVFTSNTPARLRMAVLYGVAALVGGRVANTCNKSEDYVGYSTKFGDSAGDFSPLSDLTVREVRALGTALGLPDVLVHKPPEDGLSGKTDEDNLGFTYEVLDRYIETGEIDDLAAKEKIDRLHRANLHKILPMPQFRK